MYTMKFYRGINYFRGGPNILLQYIAYVSATLRIQHNQVKIPNLGKEFHQCQTLSTTIDSIERRRHEG